MKYTIKTYEEGFIEDQFKICSRLFDKWRMGGQTRRDQLKTHYSKENFDPETRLYAFDGDNMVAFLAATSKDGSEGEAYFEFPYFYEGHNGASEQLIDHAFQKLKEKGFTKLITRAGPYWGQTKENALRYGFTIESEIVTESQIALDEFDMTQLLDPNGVNELNFETSGMKLAEFMAPRWNTTVEQAYKNMNPLGSLKIGESRPNPWDQLFTLVSRLVIFEGEEIVGEAMAANVEAFGSKTVNLISLNAKDDSARIKSKLLNQILQDCKNQEYHILVVHSGPWGAPANERFFSDLGLKFSSKLAYYCKNL